MTRGDGESKDEDVGQLNEDMDCDPTLSGVSSSNEPTLLTQRYLNDIVRDLNLSKKEAELLGSRLKDWNLLRQDTKVCGRGEVFKEFFFHKNSVVFCNDICSVWKFLAMNLTQISSACSLIREK